MHVCYVSRSWHKVHFVTVVTPLLVFSWQNEEVQLSESKLASSTSAVKKAGSKGLPLLSHWAVPDVASPLGHSCSTAGLHLVPDLPQPDPDPNKPDSALRLCQVNTGLCLTVIIISGPDPDTCTLSVRQLLPSDLLSHLAPGLPSFAEQPVLAALWCNFAMLFWQKETTLEIKANNCLFLEREISKH